MAETENERWMEQCIELRRQLAAANERAEKAEDDAKYLKEVLADKRRLARELDVALSGEEGAAKQASLCDLIGPVRALKAERDGLQARIARLLQALADRAILAEYDCPGDAPEICGWQCEICGALGAEPSDLDHAPTCLFAAAEAAQKGKAP